MKLKLLVMIIAIMAIGSQAFGATDLYVNGSLASPAAGPNEDLYFNPFFCGEGIWQFDLLYEETPNSDRNSFGVYSDLELYGGSGSNKTYIFDQRAGLDVSTGTSTIVDLGSATGSMGFFLFNDVNDNGVFDQGANWHDAMLYSERGLTAPNPPGSDYQWFMSYNTNTFGYSHFEFNGLDFYGDYDFLLFIDDDHVTYPNYDHNDMVIGGKCASPVPEPGTLMLLGLGLSGAGAFYRRKRKLS